MVRPMVRLVGVVTADWKVGWVVQRWTPVSVRVMAV